MKKINASCLLALLMLSTSASFAAERTITLSVPGMNCPSCPYMIEQSISVVDGVQSADAKLETRTCSVTFDDAVATVEDILGATAGIGYPSTIIK